MSSKSSQDSLEEGCVSDAGLKPIRFVVWIYGMPLQTLVVVGYILQAVLNTAIVR